MPERASISKVFGPKAKVLPGLPLLAVGVAVLLWMSPLLFGGKALFWGTPALQFVPWWSYAFQTSLEGHLPLWNPGAGMGAPLLANYQSALFYPGTWFLAFFYILGGTPWLAWALAPLLGLHMLFSAGGMALLLRRLGQGVLAQSTGALVWALSSYLTARVNFPSIVFCAAWLPWILLLLTPQVGKPFFRKGNFLGLTACLAMLLLSGHAQTAWYVLLFSAAWCAFWAIYAGQVFNETGFGVLTGRVAWLKRLAVVWAWFGAAGLLAAGIAAVQLAPTAEYLLQSQRAQAVDFDLAMSYSLWPWKLASLLAPGLFGSPAQGDYWGYANYWEDAVYIGLLPLLLGISFLLKPATRIRAFYRDSTTPTWLGKPIKTWIIIGVWITLLWALGRFTPVFPWLYQHVPTFDLFQAPARVLIWFEFLLALLAGLGANLWRRPQGRSLYWTRLATAGAAAVSLGAGLAWIFLGEVSPTMLRSAALAGGWGVLAGILSLTAPQPDKPSSDQPAEPARRNVVWQLAVVTIILLDLLVAAWGLNPAIPLDFYRVQDESELVERLLASKRAYIPTPVEETLKFERYFRFDTFDAEEPWTQMRQYRLPNLGMLEGKALVNNFDPLVPGRYQSWITHLNSLRIDEDLELLVWMGVDQVLLGNEQEPASLVWQSVPGGNRLHWVVCAEYAPDEQAAWQRVTHRAFDWKRLVVLEGENIAGEGDCVDTAQADPVSLTWEPTGNPNHIRARVHTTDQGWLVLADTWYPGWQVRLDGSAAERLRANYLFQAVAVPPGEHTVELFYRPLSFWLGLSLSLVSLGIAARLGLWGRRKYG